MAADDLSSLSMFLAIAEERSFTKAAKRLGITPSAVSHAMRDFRVIVDHLELVISTAVDGIGLAYMSEEHGAEHLTRGALVKVLEDWCQRILAFFVLS